MVIIMRLLWFCLMPALAAGLAVMSIDFGGEFLKIAIVKPGVPMEIVLNKESQRKTPAAVSIRDGERFFGEPALNDAIRYPKKSYRYLHEVIGKDFENPLVAEFRKKYPYYDIERDPKTGSVLFVHDENTKYSPEELVAMILQKAKEYAETFAEQPITEAVITVPAFYNQAERRAMLRAADLAGLKILQLMNDNTAVALQYGVFRRKSFNATPSYFMFFDIGASATVATVVEYQVVKVKSPTSGIVDTFPQLTVRGIGYDRTLGGSVFQRRLRDHLANGFNSVKKTKKDIFSDEKALHKLFKESGRVKQILSANVEHFAQVENLLDDEDFRMKVTREEFEGLCPDLFDRIAHTVKEALDSSQITLSEISEVILMGGGTRVPKIQEVLKESIKRENLGKGINTDEAAALGAVYQAANLGKGFKVQKFNIKDGVIYPIQVEFERVRSDSDSSAPDEATKIIKRTLFGRMQTYPQKKVMTFNKHIKDFSFEVNYGDLSFLDIRELKELGNTTVETVSLTGVDEAFSKHSQDGTVAKGIKAHFRLDDSGLLHVDRVEATFEKVVTETVEVPVEDEESTFAKLGKSFSKFFGGSDDKEEGKDGTVNEEEWQEIKATATNNNETESADPNVSEDGVKEAKDDDTKIDAKQTKDKEASDKVDKEYKDGEIKDDDKYGDDDEAKKQLEDDADKKQDESFKSDEEDNTTTKDEEQTDKLNSSSSSKIPPPPDTTNDSQQQGDAKKDGDSSSSPPPPTTTDDKTKEGKVKTKTKEKQKNVVLKEDLKVNVEVHDLREPDAERMKLAKKHLDDLRKRDEEKMLLEKVKNEIETFIFDTRDKLEQPDYIKCSTESERNKISEDLSAASDWMYDQEDGAPRKIFEDKLRELHKGVRNLFDRVYELQERPMVMEALNSRVNHSEYFLEGMKNFTALNVGDDQPFTAVEMETLKNLIDEIKQWNATVQKDQSETPLTEKPKFTVEDVVTKINSLDREIKYLIAKVKNFKPKTTTPPPAADDAATGGNTTSKKKKKQKKAKSPETDESQTVNLDDIPGLGGDGGSTTTPADEETTTSPPKTTTTTTTKPATKTKTTTTTRDDDEDDDGDGGGTTHDEAEL